MSAEDLFAVSRNKDTDHLQRVVAFEARVREAIERSRKHVLRFSNYLFTKDGSDAEYKFIRKDRYFTDHLFHVFRACDAHRYLIGVSHTRDGVVRIHLHKAPPAPKAYYHRPETRGELREKLMEGVECEITVGAVSYTRIMLDAWLEMEGKYQVRPSENQGWVVLYGTPEACPKQQPQ